MSLTSSLTSISACLNAAAKEIVRSSGPGGNTVDSPGDVSGYYDLAPRPCENKLVYEKETEESQQNDKGSPDGRDFTPVTVTQDHPKGKVESRFSPFEALITRSFGEAEGDLMAEDEEILSSGFAELGACGKNGPSTRENSRFQNAIGQFRPESWTPDSLSDSECVQSNSISYRGIDSGYSDANDSALPGKKSFGRNNMTEKVVDVLENKQIPLMGSLQGLPVGRPDLHDHNTDISYAQYMNLPNLSSNPEDGFSALVTNLRFFVNFRQYGRLSELRSAFPDYL